MPFSFWSFSISAFLMKMPDRGFVESDYLNAFDRLRPTIEEVAAKVSTRYTDASNDQGAAGALMRNSLFHAAGVGSYDAKDAS